MPKRMVHSVWLGRGPLAMPLGDILASSPEGHLVVGGVVQSCENDPLDARLLPVFWHASPHEDISRPGPLPLGAADGVGVVLGQTRHSDGIEGRSPVT